MAKTKTYLGTMNYRDVNQATEHIREAIKQKYFAIDSAWIYRNEDIIRQALANLRKEGLEIKVQTKIWTAEFKRTKTSFKEMLERLQLKSVYSLLLHRPSFNLNDDVKAWKDLIELKQKGLVEHIGVSNYDKDMIDVLFKETGVMPEFNQVELSLTNFRADRVAYAKDKNIEVQAWSPMGKTPSKITENSIVKKLAKKYKTTPGQIALSFLTSQGISIVPGTSKVERIKDNNTFVKLTKAEITLLTTLNTFDNKFTETYP